MTSIQQSLTRQVRRRVRGIPAAPGRTALAGLLLGLLAMALTGCEQAPTAVSPVLMQSANRIVTVAAYRQELNIYRTATGIHPHEDAAAYREMQMRFVRQMVDQLVLLEHAHALGIEISDRDLEAALADLRHDYPDEVFEQLLLENAITLDAWKASLRTRLIIERVVREELERNVRISEADMAQFMARMQRARRTDKPDDAAAVESPSSDEAIVNQLRRSKTEQAFDEWMAALKRKYPVVIDQAVLSTLLAATSGSNDSPIDSGRRPSG